MCKPLTPHRPTHPAGLRERCCRVGADGTGSAGKGRYRHLRRVIYIRSGTMIFLHELGDVGFAEPFVQLLVGA